MSGSSERLDFGYSWLWQWGHGVLGVVFAGLAAALGAADAPVRAVAVAVAAAVWGFVGLVLMQVVFRAHAPLTLPTEDFLSSNAGTVLDLGCGSGRTSILVGQARRRVRIVGLDNFSATYIRDHGRERLLRNLRIAGVADRFEFKEGDMRRLPFADETFDAAVSSYALDHLGKEIPLALAEARRVLRPGGEFLLIVILPNLWTSLAFLSLVWLRFPTRAKWRRLFDAAGLTVEAAGTGPRGGWFLLRRA
jgi:SAM-dependent methyltransferase